MWRAWPIVAALLLAACSSAGGQSPASSSAPAAAQVTSSQRPYTLPPNSPETPQPAVTIGYRKVPLTAGQRFRFLTQVRGLHDLKIELSPDKHKVHVGRQVCVGLSNGVTPTHMVNGFVRQHPSRVPLRDDEKRPERSQWLTLGALCGFAGGQCDELGSVRAWSPRCGSTVIGARRITVVKRMDLGVMTRGFADRRMGGLLRVVGTCRVAGSASIGQGARIDVGAGGHLELGDLCSIGPSSLVVAMHRVSIGYRTAISWDCQILDSNFHNDGSEGVTIGSDCWLGTRSLVLPGTHIPDGCIVAAGAVVRGSDFRPQSLIAGNPARSVKDGVSWAR